jgi:hypothetical protein
MPYIDPASRIQIAAGREPRNTGELNYVITVAVQDYLGDTLSYEKINAAIGVLECAKLELYRRVAAGYEDLKIIQNGDV